MLNARAYEEEWKRAGLQIAVSEAFAVRRIKGVKYLPSVLNCLPNRQRTFERGAIDQFHHQIIRADVVELTDFRAIECRKRPRLTRKALRKLRCGNFIATSRPSRGSCAR